MKHTIFKDNPIQDLASSTLLLLVVDGLRLTSKFYQMGCMTSLPMMEIKAKVPNIQEMKFPYLEKNQRKGMLLYPIGLVLT